MQYMIERQCGPNRDWLAAYGPSDKSTTWVCGAKCAMIFPNITQAYLMLDRAREAASTWENRGWFHLVVIEDRRELPDCFASTQA